MRKTFKEAEARKLVADILWAELELRLDECGLHKTARELNDVKRTMGWELAELLEKKQKEKEKTRAGKA